jgi:glycine cleavage system H protein
VEDDICVLGITEYAQKELGEVVFVELPEAGQSFEAHDEIGTIESVKAVAELYTPVSGEISESNEAVADDPAVLNEDPYGDGWLVKVRFGSPKELDELMSHEEYADYVSEGDD